MLNSVVEKVYEQGIIDEIADNLGVPSNEWDDFLQEIYLILLEYNPEKIIGMYERGELKWWLIRVCINQFCSSNSPYFKKYKKYYTITDGNHFNLADEVLEDEVGFGEDYE
jgi:hypothetical protein